VSQEQPFRRLAMALITTAMVPSTRTSAHKSVVLRAVKEPPTHVSTGAEATCRRNSRSGGLVMD
jgi:hypothetical protein